LSRDLSKTNPQTMNWSLYLVIFVLALAALATWLAFMDTGKMTVTNAGNGAGKTMCLIVGILALVLASALLGYMVFLIKTGAVKTMGATASTTVYGVSAVLLLGIGIMLLIVNGKMGKVKKGIKTGWLDKEIEQAISKSRTTALTMAIVFSALIVLVGVVGWVKSRVGSKVEEVVGAVVASNKTSASTESAGPDKQPSLAGVAEPEKQPSLADLANQGMALMKENPGAASDAAAEMTKQLAKAM